jgi:hypothetical protein
VDAGVSRLPEGPFGPIEKVAVLLRGFSAPWFVAGGWAIDLVLERVTRPHEDIDIAFLRRDQDAMRPYLSGWTFTKVVLGERSLWREGERLQSPVHEIHAHRMDGDPADLELLLEEVSGDAWVFRRDRRITRPLMAIGIQAASGVPFLVPEIVLLYKAKDPSAKDSADFELVGPRLDAGPREWLRHALEVCHPGHPWIRRL